jgi:hypothetical protein
MAKKPKLGDAPAELLTAASPKILTDLILELVAEWLKSCGSAPII